MTHYQTRAALYLWILCYLEPKKGEEKLTPVIFHQLKCKKKNFETSLSISYKIQTLPSRLPTFFTLEDTKICPSQTYRDSLKAKAIREVGYFMLSQNTYSSANKKLETHYVRTPSPREQTNYLVTMVLGEIEVNLVLASSTPARIVNQSFLWFRRNTTLFSLAQRQSINLYYP
jgi:hypothetical protein